MDGSLSRREVLSLTSASAVAALAGCAEPTAGRSPVVDFDELENTLEIEADSTHVIHNDQVESYDSVRWESTGTLEMDPDAGIELTDISN